jgi:hypothetical protein
MNGGQPLPIDLTPIELAPNMPDIPGFASDGDELRAWSFEGAGGVDSYGGKPVKSFEFSADGVEPIELRRQVRAITGKSIKVEVDETTSGNCSQFGDLADLEALPEMAAEIFTDGFESGDVSVWSYTGP